MKMTDEQRLAQDMLSMFGHPDGYGLQFTFSERVSEFLEEHKKPEPEVGREYLVDIANTHIIQKAVEKCLVKGSCVGPHGSGWVFGVESDYDETSFVCLSVESVQRLWGIEDDERVAREVPNEV